MKSPLLLSDILLNKLLELSIQIKLLKFLFGLCMYFRFSGCCEQIFIKKKPSFQHKIAFGIKFPLNLIPN